MSKILENPEGGPWALEGLGGVENGHFDQKRLFSAKHAQHIGNYCHFFSTTAKNGQKCLKWGKSLGRTLGSGAQFGALGPPKGSFLSKTAMLRLAKMDENGDYPMEGPLDVCG